MQEKLSMKRVRGKDKRAVKGQVEEGERQKQSLADCWEKGLNLPDFNASTCLGWPFIILSLCFLYQIPAARGG